MNLLKKSTLFVLLLASACGSNSSSSPDREISNEPDMETSNQVCSDFDESSCSQQPECIPIMGKAYNESNTCLEAESFVICWEEDDTICGDSIAAAIESPSGDCWFQDSICKPSSWAQATDDKSVCADAYANTTVCP